MDPALCEIEKLKKNLLLISPAPPPLGGIATWTNLYIKELHKINFNFTFINSSSCKLPNIFSIFAEIFGTSILITKIIFFCTLNSFQVAHISTSCSRFGTYRDILISKILKIYKVSTIIHIHCNIQDVLNIYNNAHAIRKLLMISDEIVVLNQHSKRYVKENINKDSIIIPNFINYDKSLKKIISQHIKLLTFVGHITKYKGIKQIIETAKQCPDLSFNLVGRIIDKNILNDIPKNVNYLGIKSQKQIKKILLESDVFLFPSYTEGFSVALLEAMKHGLPIIASDVGANAEMIENDGGIILNRIDSEEIMKAISLLESQEVRKKASEFNLYKVAREYEISIVTRTWTELYNSLLK